MKDKAYMSRTFLQLCKREWKRILLDPRIAALMLVVPFIYVSLFGGEYWAGSVKHVPIAIADQDHSRLSRDITTSLAASESLTVLTTLNSPQDFLPLVRRESAYACVVFPEHFERDVLGGKRARVAVIIDGSNLLIGNVTTRAINAVLTEYRIGMSAEQLAYAGIASSAAKSVAAPIRPVLLAPFNPVFNYSYFILMGLVCVVLQQVTRMGSSISLALDEVDELWRKLPGPAPNVLWIYISKSAATAALVLPVSYVAIALPFVLYGAPFRGSVLFLWVVLSLHMIMQIFIGYGFCLFCRSPVIATQIHLFMSVILFILSGFTWPFYAMPHWIRPLVYCIPLFHMNSILRKVALDGAGPRLVTQHLFPLFVWLIVAIAWGYLAVWKHMARTGRAKARW